MLVYDGMGTLSTITKLTSCTSFSNLGIVVSLEAKYSRQSRLFVAEFTRNYDKVGAHSLPVTVLYLHIQMNDSFTGTPKVGLNFFPLWERLHQFHGHRAWVCPLQNALSASQQAVRPSLLMGALNDSLGAQAVAVGPARGETRGAQTV